uniref:ATP synthase F0 subunit 8 n=1 Tax=Japanagallia spinosa TaxID=2008760 RepID=A0A343DQX4_9HEMI|nr:ATP synthase F0 subunit 8 [Japanagallia spinosa]ARX63982.1 ATP synthase F0 subunit 8 [Japanagallia spinosa]
MPQMAPIWWFTLSMMFNINMMITISTIYFNKNVSLKTHFFFNKKNLNWKW